MMRARKRSAPLVMSLLVPLGCWTAPAPAPPQPVASPPAIPDRFADSPLGPGTCKWISIGEASEIVGQQLRYLDPVESAYHCVLVPAKGEVPSVSVSQIGVAVDEWTPPAGIGEHSAWSGDAPFETLAFRLGGTALHIDVNIPGMPGRAKERRALVEAIARKVYARLKANPDGGSS
jgi:hypothetical protein